MGPGLETRDRVHAVTMYGLMGGFERHLEIGIGFFAARNGPQQQHCVAGVLESAGTALVTSSRMPTMPSTGVG